MDDIGGYIVKKANYIINEITTLERKWGGLSTGLTRQMFSPIPLSHFSAALNSFGSLCAEVDFFSDFFDTSETCDVTEEDFDFTWKYNIVHF